MAATTPLTARQILALVDGDDSLDTERAWIIRNTFALAESTVISERLARALIQMCPDATEDMSSIIHIQIYSVPNTNTNIFTLWTPITWLESTERRRFQKEANSTWRQEASKKKDCESLIEETVMLWTKLSNLKVADRNKFVDQLGLIAAGTKFDPKVFAEKLDAIVAMFPALKEAQQQQKQSENKTQSTRQDNTKDGGTTTEAQAG